MKREVKEFYEMFTEGSKVLIKKRVGYRQAGWEPAFVLGRETSRNTAIIRHQEKFTGHVGYTFYRCRADIKRACEETDCWKEAIACRLIDYLANEPKETIDWFCVDHCHKNGYCYGCGEFWGGVEPFEFSKSGLCENCEDELEAELGESEEYEDFVY